MTEKEISPYEQGHVIVSAVRLFSYREGKMPTASDISTLSGFSMDITLLLCNKLVELGALKVVTGAFDDRYHVSDHLKLEELPKAIDEDEMIREVEKFKADRMEKKKKIEEMFTGKDFDRKKRERMKKLDDRFKDPSSKKRPNPLDSLTRPDGESEKQD
ncbi:MAG: hypothetical protein ACE5OP_05415 [Candidatus Glassbacteria bacterium]